MFTASRALYATRLRPPLRVPPPRQGLGLARWAHTKPEPGPPHALAREGSVGKHPFDLPGAAVGSGGGGGGGGGGGAGGGGGGGGGSGGAGGGAGEGGKRRMRDGPADPIAGPSGRRPHGEPREDAAPRKTEATESKRPDEPVSAQPSAQSQPQSSSQASSQQSQSQSTSQSQSQSQSQTQQGPQSQTPQVLPPDAPTLPTHILPTRAAPPHPFDTYAFVSHLEQANLGRKTARTLMEAVREMVSARTAMAHERMLSQEEMDNDAYRFKAAVSDIRTGHSVRSRRDGVALRAAASAIRREVDGLEQKIKEDIAVLRHDVEIDLNNRKSETRSDMKRFDIAREEINNKFTISLGDLRTEIEGAKWDATRRAITIIITLVIIGVALSTVGAKPAADPVPPPKPAPTMVDIAVGPDPQDEHEAHLRDAEAHLERLLGEHEMRRRKEAAAERAARDVGVGVGVGASSGRI